MIQKTKYDVAVIGGGPAGLAAAIEADKGGAKVLLIEREARLGGILKQCIHDGFGLVRYGEKLSGPEYAYRFITEFEQLKIDKMLRTFVTKIDKIKEGYDLCLVTSDGIKHIEATAIIFATGCRERTARQAAIHGTRPAGIFTAGNAQNYINLLGEMVAKKAVILGSGDIGLIMARRLTLEGAKVIGVFEAQNKPSGLTRNIQQCLVDFDIPLELSTTVTRVFGDKRLNAVEIAKVDENMSPIEGTQRIIECDTLIVSVGLIPENELIEQLAVEMDPKTKGPKADENGRTSQRGIFTCGNSYHVFDLVDHVSSNAEKAGKAAAEYVKALQRLKTDSSDDAFAFAPVEVPVPEKGGLIPKNGNIVCVVCPKSCEIHVDKITLENGEVTYETSGNSCVRGHDFAVSEMIQPVRTICSTVRTTSKELPVLPVRVSKDIPKSRIFDVMKEINKITISNPVKPGDVLIKNVLDTGADVIAASELKLEE